MSIKSDIASLGKLAFEDRINLILLLHRKRNITDISIRIDKIFEFLKFIKKYKLISFLSFPYSAIVPKELWKNMKIKLKSGSANFASVTHFLPVTSPFVPKPVSTKNPRVLPTFFYCVLLRNYKKFKSVDKLVWSIGSKRGRLDVKKVNKATGLIMGYPKCCIKQYNKYKFPAVRFWKFKPPIEFYVLPYIPCSLNCKESNKNAKAILKFIKSKYITEYASLIRHLKRKQKRTLKQSSKPLK